METTAIPTSSLLEPREVLFRGKPVIRFPRYDIQDLIDLAYSNMLSIRKHRLQCGRIFNACKASIPHGKWKEFFEDNFAKQLDLRIRDAQRWMWKAEQNDKFVVFKLKPADHQLAQQAAVDNERGRQDVQAAKPRPYRLYFKDWNPQRRKLADNIWAKPEIRAAAEERLGVCLEVATENGVSA